GELGRRLAEAEQALEKVGTELDALAAGLPNIPHESVPGGAGGPTMVEVRRPVEPPRFDVGPQDHVSIGQRLGLVDFDAAAKLSGSRFVVLRGAVARLHRALAQFMLDLHEREHGYTEFYVPYLVRDAALYGTGQLPKFAADLFAVEGGYRLIPTAEVSLTNLVREDILDASALPMRIMAHTPCFRSE